MQEDLHEGGRIILKWILEKQVGVVESGWMWFKSGPMVGTC
jgi:hypothetical protein